MKIAILVFEGFDELDAIAPYEVLCNAASAGADLRVEIVTGRKLDKVVASHGLVIKPQGQLSDSYDLVIVSGGGWVKGTGIREQVVGELPGELARLHKQGVVMAAVCTGALVLAVAGITEGRPVNTHPAAREYLAQTGAQVVDDRVVDDGDLITAAGVTAGLDLALWLVEREWGKKLADEVAVGMDYTRVGSVRVKQ